MPSWPRVIADLPEPLAALLGAGSYRTHRPACQGHAPLFDESVWGETAQQREDRHDHARQVCDRCPAHAACAAAVAELPRSFGGVWAGVVLSDERYRVGSTDTAGETAPVTSTRPAASRSPNCHPPSMDPTHDHDHPEDHRPRVRAPRTDPQHRGEHVMNAITPISIELWATDPDHDTPGRVVAFWSFDSAASHAVCVGDGRRGVRLIPATKAIFHLDEQAARDALAAA